MSRYDGLRSRLTRLAAKTASAEGLGPPSWWVGDRAGKRQVLDDAASGRLSWRAAHKAALDGLEALLSNGDRDLAETYAWAATDHYVGALEARTRIRPSEMQALGQTAARRARPRKKPEKK